MRPTFNVLDRAWIPVRTMRGTVETLGIRQVLARAHELREITVASPMEEYSVYRFLSVFLMDALRPETETDIEDLLGEGRFDMEAIEDYIGQCNAGGERFDLFDPERPFLQSPYDASIDKEVKPVGVMDYTLPSGNNHTHFDHRNTKLLQLTPEQAARLLIAAQIFCTAGAQGYPSGVNASPPFFSVIKEQSLFKTLTYTLLPLDSIGLPLDEPPVLWRSRVGVRPKMEVSRTSWLRGMLFPARRILLDHREDSEMIDGVYFCQGENFVSKETWRDPFVTYRTTVNGVAPLRPAGYRPVWHNANDMIDVPGNHASLLLAQYVSISGSEHASVMLYGVETSQASYLSVCRYDLSFPTKLAADPGHVELLTMGISASETLGGSLRRSLSDIPSVPGSVVGVTVQRYYKECEAGFWDLCEAAAKGDRKRREMYASWCDEISGYAKNAFVTAVSTLRLRASALAEAARAQDRLMLTIGKLKKEARQE